MNPPPNEVLFASAGSGKTFELTSRYLTLLASGEDPATILATTFTRTAAGEILERLTGRLLDACESESSRAELCEHIKTALTREQCARLLDQLIQNVHRVNVGTIDAMLARMAGVYAMELGIAPGWKIANVVTDQELRERALDLTLAEGEPSDNARLIEMLLGSESLSIRDSVLEQLAQALADVRDIEQWPDAWDALRPTSHPLDNELLALAIQALERMPIPNTKAGKPDKRWQTALRKMLAAARVGDWQIICGYMLSEIGRKGEGSFYKVPATDDQIRALERVSKHAASIELWRHFKRSLARRELVLRFDTHYQAIKRREGLLQFDDLPRLLIEAGVIGDLDDLYFRLDARTRHVLLDEFQDTSITQFQLLAPILDEILAQSDGRSVFVVGDAKQSLFGWRHAEPELLAHLPKRWKQLHRRSLAKSWRSSQVVLDAVNTVFESLETNTAIAQEPASRRWRQRFEHHVAAKEQPGSVRLICANPTQDEDAAEAVHRVACQRVRDIHENHPEASIGVIVRRNKVVAELVSRLRDIGLEASEEGGSTLTDCAPVVAALSLIQLADHPGDTASAFHVANSPIGKAIGLRDDRDLDRVARIASDLRVRINASGLATYLSQLADRIASGMEHREADRFESLIDLAQEFDAAGWTRLDRFVALVCERRIDSPSRGLIRVLTIHRAKGLEFDAVILPELDRKIEPRTDGILIERDGPLGPIIRACVAPSKEIRSLDDRLEQTYQASRQRHLEEGISLLYVAMTRARHSLDMIVQDPPASSTLSHAGILCAALAPDRAPDRSPDECASDQQNDQPDPQPDLLYHAGDDGWICAPGEPSASPPTQSLPLRLRTRQCRPISRLARLAASDDGGRILLRDRLSVGSSYEQRRGLLIHHWLEAIEWLDDVTISDNWLKTVADRGGFDTSFAARFANDFRNMLARPEIRDLLSRPKDNPELWRERPFAIRLARGNTDHLVSGRFDRVYVSQKQGTPGSAHVIDFKTDAIDSDSIEAGLASLTARYASQMSVYRRAVCSLLGLPDDKVRCSLALLGAGLVVDVPRASS